MGDDIILRGKKGLKNWLDCDNEKCLFLVIMSLSLRSHFKSRQGINGGDPRLELPADCSADCSQPRY